MAEQNDVAKLYDEFEEAFVDVLTAKSEGVSFSRRMKLRLARSRLRAHKDFTQREYDAAVLRAEARAWKLLFQGCRGPNEFCPARSGARDCPCIDGQGRTGEI